MISAGSITVKCDDPNDQSTRLVAERLVARFASKNYRIFKASSGLQRKKRVLLDAYVKNPGDKGTLIKIMRRVRWNQLSKSFTAYFMRDFAASSAAKFIVTKYNRRSLNKYLVIPVWRQVFTNRPNTHQCSANPLVPLRRPVTRPSGKQRALQNALVEAVRKVFGPSKTESYARMILKTQKWSMLKQAGVVYHIMKAFGRLRYHRASKISRVARRLIKKTLRNWKKSSGTVQQPPVQRVPTHRPALRPARPAPVPTRPRPADNQLALQNALVTAVRKVFGALKTESYARMILKTQKWSMLKQAGVVSHIQEAFRNLGYRRAAKNSYLAKRLVKKTLGNWKKTP